MTMRFRRRRNLGNRQRLSHVESLERRNLLACTVAEAGDANRDCYFDEADFVLSMRAGKFETGLAARWSEGDWSGDGLFNSADFVAAFQTANYRNGAYAETAEQPVTDLAPFDANGKPDVTVYYLPDTGDIIAVAETYMTTIHLRSQSQRFGAERQGPPPFDVNTSGDLFVVVPEGYQVLQFLAALPAGMSDTDVEADLLVTGSTYGGGGLGNVQLGVAAALPVGLPYDGVPPGGTGAQIGGQTPVVDPPKMEPPAIGNAAGDANRDGHVDAADLIQALKSGAYETETPVDWERGDWSGDQRFTSFDLVQLFKDGYYGTGPYNESAGEAVNQLRDVAPASEAELADVTLHYDPETGDLVVASHAGLMTAVQLVAQNAVFRQIDRPISPTPFDQFNDSNLFVFRTEGVAAARILGALPKYLTAAEALGGIRVDGALKLGGGLGFVALGTAAQLPTGDITEINRRPHADAFVDIADATVTLTYDAANGDVTLTALGFPMQAVELVSDDEIFVGTLIRDYRVGIFDIAQPDRYFRLEPNGVDVIHLPEFLQPGLSVNQIVSLGFSGNGALLGKQPLAMALTFTDSSTAQLEGVVYEDDDRDGAHGPSEVLRERVSITLEAISDGTTYQAEASPATSGAYRFAGLPTGDYWLSIAAPVGFIQPPRQQVSVRSQTVSIGSNFQLLTTTPDGFVAGDSNGDFFFDEADWIQVMKAGKFATAADAAWTEGDFDRDGDFDAEDMTIAESLGPYRSNTPSHVNISTARRHARVSLEYDLEDAAINVFYLQETGAFAIISQSELSSFQLHSESGWLSPGTVENAFDVRSSNSAFWLDPAGVSAVGGLVVRGRMNLTVEQILNDLTVDGSHVDGTRLGAISLSVISSHQLTLSCYEILAAGATPGDANLDGIFDSSDLVYVFQRGEYGDDESDNSNWHDGDWNCDGEFDSADIVAAFQAGGFNYDTNPATAAVIRRIADE